MSTLLTIIVVSIAVLLTLALALAIASGVGRGRFAAKVHGEVRRLFSAGAGADFADAPIDEGQLGSLPAPAARYLRWAGVLGKAPSRYARLRQRGRFRTDPRGRWMPLAADQYYAVDDPGFVWFAVVNPAPGLHLRVRDRFLDGHGEIDGRLMSILRVVHAEGDEVDQGALLRLLSELIWLPTAFLSSHVRWEPAEDPAQRDRFARVYLRVGEREVGGVIEVDEEGKPLDFRAQRYFVDERGDARLELWSTPIQQWGELGGFNVPTRGQAVWKLAEGDFVYVDLEITRVDHDVPSLFSEV
jgi:hypothetical protein